MLLRESNPGHVDFSMSQCAVWYFKADLPIVRGWGVHVHTDFQSHLMPASKHCVQRGRDFYRVFIIFHAKRKKKEEEETLKTDNLQL